MRESLGTWEASPNRTSRALALCGVLSLCLVPAADASAAPRGELEAGGIYYGVDENFSDTYGGYLRGRFAPTTRDAWFAEAVTLERFDDDGTYVAGGNVHHFDDRWFSRLAVGSSSGGFFWPRVRVDGNLSRKWLARSNFVTTVGVSYFDAKDAHSDVGFTLEGSYYTDSPWVVQMGTTINESSPGAVTSASGYGAVSYIRPRRRHVSLRVAGGQQAYTALNVEQFVVDFSFTDVRLTWKQWIGKQWGVNVVADSYQSSVYDQRGFEIGLFTEF